MSGVALAGVFALTGIMLGVVLILLRHRAYCRRIFYNPGQSCVLGMAGPGIETISVRCDDAGFVVPESVIGAPSGLLALEVRASLVGRLSDPAVQIKAREFRDAQYLERGVHGVRFLNVSRLLASKSLAEEWVHLSGHGVAWRAGTARLHICREKLSADDRVLVVAPHPDDAEIAAFGLYADTRATVVTLTSGDASDRYCSAPQSWMKLPRAMVAKIRVWDSVTIPQFGNVPPEQAVNLCYPDGQMADMHRLAGRDFRGEGEAALDFNGLRRLNRSPLVHHDATCTWKSLIRDLCHIIEDTKPTILVAPHPSLDPNPDHLFATVALTEALQSVGSTTRRMFFYVVHNRRSELWPFGPAGTGTALLPIMAEDGVCASGFYSHSLSVERQREKFIALEAMHDLRDLQWPGGSSHQQSGARLIADFRALANGIGAAPTSYFRRAVRPDELFFVMSVAEGVSLAQRAMEQRASRRAAV